MAGQRACGGSRDVAGQRERLIDRGWPKLGGSLEHDLALKEPLESQLAEV